MERLPDGMFVRLVLRDPDSGEEAVHERVEMIHAKRQQLYARRQAGVRATE